MAYLPFYITPEEFEVYQEEQARQIASSPDAIQWQTLNLENKHRWFRKWFVVTSSLLGSALPLSIFHFTSKEPFFENPFVLGFLPICLFMTFICYISYGWDDRFNYTFSSKGLVYRRQINQPDWLVNINRYVAIVVAAISIIALVTIGPGAFVGVGGLALLSFGMMKKRKVDVFTTIAEPDDLLYAQYNRKRRVIAVYTKYDYCAYAHKETGMIRRGHTRGSAFVFFNSDTDMDNAIHKLSQRFGIKVEEYPDSSTFFEAEAYPQLILDIDVKMEKFNADDVISLRTENA